MEEQVNNKMVYYIKKEIGNKKYNIQDIPHKRTRETR